MRARNIAVLGLMVAVAAPLLAQQPPQPRPGQPEAVARRQAMVRAQMPRAQAGPTPEMVLRLREQLSLTEAQVGRLEALRREGVNARRERMAEMLDLRSQVEAGRITREELQAQVRSRAEAARATPPNAGERVREVLTDQQRVRLAELQVERMQRALQAQRRGPGRIGAPGARPQVRAMRRIPPGQAPGVDRLRERMVERRMPLRRPPAGPGGAGPDR